MGNCCSRSEISIGEGFENEKTLVLESLKAFFQWLNFEEIGISPSLEALFFFLDFLNELLKNPKMLQPNIAIFTDFRVNLIRFKNEIMKLDKKNINEDENFLLIRKFINQINNYFPKIDFLNYDKNPNIISKNYDDLLNKLKEKCPQDDEIKKKIKFISGFEFWLKIGNYLEEVNFKLFLEKFNEIIYNSSYEKSFIIVLYSIICSNFNFKVNIVDWDKFYRNIWVSSSITRPIFFSQIENLKQKLENHNEKQLKLIQNTIPNKDNPINMVFNISENINNEKNLISDPITIGSTNDSDFKISSNQNIELLEIFYKYDNILADQTLESDFYLNLLNNEKIMFLVDEKGFVLTEKMLININGNYMKIKKVYPTIPLYSDPDFNYLETRPKNTNFIQENIEINENFIEFEFYKNGPEKKNYKFVANPIINNYEINIGQSKSNNVVLNKPEIQKRHCKIVFNSTKKCWVIKDETYNKQKLPFYKTFVLGKNYYREDNIKYETRPQKLLNGMKILIGLDYIFDIEINN